MATAYLLDTDVCVDLINGQLRNIGLPPHTEIGISSITAYELQVGIEKSFSLRTKRETRGFLEALDILEFDSDAARESGKVRAELEARGVGIGPYDTLISGHCRQLNRKLISRNKKEFTRVMHLHCHFLKY